MPRIFGGRAVVITGASSGIGRSIAIEMGRCGADVWLVGRSKKELMATARSITEAGGPSARSVLMDLRQRGPLQDLIAEVGAEHPTFSRSSTTLALCFPNR